MLDKYYIIRMENIMVKNNEKSDLMERLLELENFYHTKYDCNQHQEIMKGLSANLDIKQWANPVYKPEQMSIIFKGVSEGLDPTVYADPKYTAAQMEQLFHGLKAGIDVSKYANEKIRANHMIWIRLALQKNINVEAYPDFYNGAVKAYSIYSKLTTELKDRAVKTGTTKRIYVERIKREHYYMDVVIKEMDDPQKQIEKVIEDINKQKILRVKEAEDALHKGGVYFPSRKVLSERTDIENYLYFSLDKNDN